MWCFGGSMHVSFKIFVSYIPVNLVSTFSFTLHLELKFQRAETERALSDLF